MPEENTDVKAEGNPMESLASESSPDTQEPTEETKESPQGEENRIPHSRVQEMEQKAYEKGKQEAIDKLVEKKESETTLEEPTPDPVNTDDVKAAEDLIERTVKKVVEPHFIRQNAEKFISDNPDALNYIDKIKDIKGQNKDLNWDQAYKLASFDDKLAGAEARGVERAEAGIASKESAQTMKPGSMKQEQPKGLNDKISDRSIPLSDIEAQIKNELMQ